MDNKTNKYIKHCVNVPFMDFIQIIRHALFIERIPYLHIYVLRKHIQVHDVEAHLAECDIDAVRLLIITKKNIKHDFVFDNAIKICFICHFLRFCTWHLNKYSARKKNIFNSIALDYQNCVYIGIKFI